jgi:hypothetical protein
MADLTDADREIVAGLEDMLGKAKRDGTIVADRILVDYGGKAGFVHYHRNVPPRPPLVPTDKEIGDLLSKIHRIAYMHNQRDFGLPLASCRDSLHGAVRNWLVGLAKTKETPQ